MAWTQSQLADGAGLLVTEQQADELRAGDVVPRVRGVVRRLVVLMLVGEQRGGAADGLVRVVRGTSSAASWSAATATVNAPSRVQRARRARRFGGGVERGSWCLPTTPSGVRDDGVRRLLPDGGLRCGRSRRFDSSHRCAREFARLFRAGGTDGPAAPRWIYLCGAGAALTGSVAVNVATARASGVPVEHGVVRSGAHHHWGRRQVELSTGRQRPHLAPTSREHAGENVVI